ncbi:MAG: class 1 fructose-bisphosphatase, partial [Burkholderiaceae bacterium]
MHLGRTTLSKFLIQQLKGSPQRAPLAALLVDIAAAVKAISSMTAKGALAGVLGSLESQNVQGETQKKLDVLSDKAFINTFQLGGLVAGMASEENDDPIVFDDLEAP